MPVQVTSLTIIRGPLEDVSAREDSIPLVVEREQLAKSRWRGEAVDGREFGFDLEEPLKNGDAFWRNNKGVYRICQSPEPVLVVKAVSRQRAAELAWSIGNLHQVAEIGKSELVVSDDPALRRLFQTMGVKFREDVRVFEPLRATAGHGHSHGH